MIYSIKGDVTKPQGLFLQVIAHVCNNQGGWGAGVSGAIGQAYTDAEDMYRDWCAHPDDYVEPFELGQTQFVQVDNKNNRYVANMIAQNRYTTKSNSVALHMNALEDCFKQVCKFARDNRLSVHIPYLMGAGLAGGNWDEIMALIINVLDSYKEIDLFIYEYQPATSG